MRSRDSFLLEFSKRFLLLAGGITLVGALFFALQSSRFEDLRRAEAQTLVVTERRILVDTLRATASDVHFLASVFQNAYETLGPSYIDSEQLHALLAAFMHTRPLFLQLRILTPQGKESLRMEQRNGTPTLIPKNDLQDKSNKAYFLETVPLPANQTFVSSFDLNMEHGVVERPFRPTLRLSSSIYGSEGLLGITVLNLDGSELLERLRSARRSSGIQIYMVNDAGQWIVAPERRMEWGNSLSERKAFTLSTRYPELQKHITNSPYGIFRDASGLFAYARVDLPRVENEENRLYGQESWTILAFVANTDLRPDWISHFLFLGLSVLVFVALASAFLTRQVIRRRQIERSLQESEDKIQAVSHSSHDALVMVDERGRIAFWNPAAKQILGYDAEEVLDRAAASILTPSLPCSDTNSMPALKAGPFSETICEEPVYLRRKNGKVFPAEIALSSFRLHGSWWTVNAVRDITKRITALQDLEKNREMLIEALTISRMGGFSISTDTDEVFWTDEIRQLHGVDRHFLPTLENMTSFVEESHRDAYRTALHSARRGNPVEQEFSLRTAKGRRIWIRMNIRSHYLGDKVSRLSGIYQDVTDRKLERLHMEQLSTAVEHSPASVVITNAEHLVEYVNPRFTETLGYNPSEILGNTTDRLKSGMHHESFYSSMRQTISSGKEWSGEICHKTKSGRLIWQQLSISPIKDEQDQVHHYVGILEDVTERRHALEAIQASERKIRAMSEATLDAMVVIDTTASISFWNPAATKMFGYDEKEALGSNIHDLIAIPFDRAPADCAMHDFSKTGTGPVVGITRELTALRKDGSDFPCEITVSSFSLDTQWFAVGTIRDITRRKEYERRLRDMATTDELTGLLNRRALLELADSELERSRRYGRPFCLMMLDLDKFKMVNDTYGHDVGDKVLKTLARTGSSAVRETDVLGRLGGEEFAVILPETSAAQAREVAERIRIAIAETAVDESAAPDGKVRVTISIGIAEHNPSRDNVESILKAADKALYRAKDLGRNRTEIA